MTTDPIPTGRLDDEPRSAGPYPPAGARAATLRGSLRGVDLGAYDVRIVHWLAGWDDPTVRTVASWLERVRLAERAIAAGDVNRELDVMRAEWLAMPEAERGPWPVEEAYRDGVLRAIAVIAGDRRTPPEVIS